MAVSRNGHNDARPPRRRSAWGTVRCVESCGIGSPLATARGPSTGIPPCKGHGGWCRRATRSDGAPRPCPHPDPRHRRPLRRPHARPRHPGISEQAGPHARRPRGCPHAGRVHPVFYGSFDWHSCVHGYWLLARVLRRFPRGAGTGDRRAVRPAADRREVAGECAYLDAPTARGFKRPYGWAWALKLADEWRSCPSRAGRGRWRRWPRSSPGFSRFPAALALSGAGRHPLQHRLRAADGGGLRGRHGDEALTALLRATAARWYGADADCPAWGEPSGDDFLSSALIEAEVPAPPDAGRHVPALVRPLPAAPRRAPARHLFRPATVTDRSDGKIAISTGSTSAAPGACGRSPARCRRDDARGPVLRETAEAHLDAALPHLADDYMGEHWLASFALLALEA